MRAVTGTAAPKPDPNGAKGAARREAIDY